MDVLERVRRGGPVDGSEPPRLSLRRTWRRYALTVIDRPTEPPPFSYAAHRLPDGRTRFTVRGELDLSAVPSFEAGLRQALAGPGAVLLDLSELHFMDSSGVRSVLEMSRAAAQARLGLTISRDMPPEVRQVLELTNVLELLPLE